MGGQMKGLTQFIADIRNTKAQQEEDKRIQAELVNIQRQFADHQHLSGYQRKKYICKLLFIYLLGNKIDFGFMEAIELLSSNVYSEKQIGYLAVEVFIGADRNLLLTVVNSLKLDLNSTNPEVISLALQAIATFGEETIANVLTEEVFNFLRSPTAAPILKRKASLALLKLIQVSPDIILESHPGWIQRIVAFMDHEDVALAQSTTSIVTYLAKLDPNSCKASIPFATRRLHSLIVERDCALEYFYYGVAAPWFIVKLLTLVETLVSSSRSMVDPASLAALKEVVSVVVETSEQSKHESPQAKNIQSSILFRAIALAAHLDPSTETSERMIKALGLLLDSPEINTKYLALDALVKVSSSVEPSAVQIIYQYLSKILRSLRDRDISIRKKALDLLYSICNSTTVEDICAELLANLEQADYAMKAEIAIKVIALSERFATDASWFIMTTLNLISAVGTQLPDEVWQRCIQIIVNNEKIQPLAAKSTIRKLRAGTFSESLVKVTAFVLGEFGYTVDATITPDEQFDLLLSKYYYCTFLTRAMILSSFVKMYVRYDALRPQILDLIESETISVDPEIQQRAMEYLKLLTKDDDLAFARIALQSLPPFVDNQSPLIARLGSVVATKAENGIAVASLSKNSSKSNAPPPPPAPRRARARATSFKSLASQPTSENSSRLSGYRGQLSSDNLTSTSNELMSFKNGSVADMTDTEISRDPKRSLQQLSPEWEEGYYRLLQFDQGIFYDSSMVKIIYRCKKNKNVLTVQATYINQSPVSISGFNVEIMATNESEPPYFVTTTQNPESQIPIGGKTIHLFECVTRTPFGNIEAPHLRISFMSGTFTELQLRLPILLMKNLAPAPISTPAEFFKRWQQILALGTEGESQKILSIPHRYNQVTLLRLINRLGYSIVDNVDSNSNNIVAAAILHTSTGNNGCLLRLEPDEQSKQCRITIRCTKNGIAQILTDSMAEILERGF